MANINTNEYVLLVCLCDNMSMAHEVHFSLNNPCPHKAHMMDTMIFSYFICEEIAVRENNMLKGDLQMNGFCKDHL